MKFFLSKKKKLDKILLIFDLDGTLIDSKQDIIDSFNFTFKKNQINIIDNNFFLENANNGSKYFIKKNLSPKNQNYRLVNKLNKDFTDHYSINCLKKTKKKKGLNNFLNSLGTNYISVISTNKKKKTAEKICQKLGIRKYFQEIYGVDTLKNKKPSKDHLDEIIRKYKVKKKYIIIFGDSEVDEKLASHYKLKFILIKNGYTKKRNTEIRHDLLISNYENSFSKLIKFIDHQSINYSLI